MRLAARRTPLLVLVCLLSAIPASRVGADGPGGYPPDRVVDVHHLALDLAVDLEAHAIEGTATLEVSPLREGLRRVTLHAVDLEVGEVTVDGRVVEARSTGREIHVPLAAAVGERRTIRVAYRATPEEQGLYWNDPPPGRPELGRQVWSHGEPHEARHWFPCVDLPEERQTVDLEATVPDGHRIVTNGRRVEAVDHEGPLRSARFELDRPIPAYLVTLVVGRFAVWQDDGHPGLRAFVPPERADRTEAFPATARMMDLFESLTGQPFPWPKYDQVVVRDYIWGGMEHAGATTLHERALEDARAHELRPAESLVAHELAHQWFGDLLTCRGWTHIWLNEGFATYLAALWTEHAHGRAAFQRTMLRTARRALRAGADRPILDRAYDEHGIFTGRAYQKGAWVLHMLRGLLGDETFYRGIRRYVDRHADGSVETVDLRRALEEVSGRSLAFFFDQWCRRPGAPVLEASTGWDPEARRATVTVRQVQDADPFRFPLEVRMAWAGGEETVTAEVTGRETRIVVPCPRRPRVVRIDPREVLLKELRFPKSLDLLAGDLQDADDPAGRLRACARLAEDGSDRAVHLLRETLEGDDEPLVRVRAARGLRELAPLEARDDLIEALSDPDLRARRAAARALANYRRDPAAVEALREILETDDPAAGPHPALRSAALESLATVAGDASDVLEAHLDPAHAGTFRERVRRAALHGLVTQADPGALGHVLPLVDDVHPTSLRTGAIRAVGRLGGLRRVDASRRATLVEHLEPHLADPSRSIRRATVRALRHLGSDEALPALETVARRDPRRSLRRRAERTIDAIRSGERPPDEELTRLRDELEDLREAHEELRARLDERGDDEAPGRDGGEGTPEGEAF